MEVLACGADSFITKSYDEDYLLSYVEKTMANKSLQKSKNPGIELEIAITGTSRMITAEPHKMISLLLSTYDAAVRRTSELIQTQDELRSLNDHLEDLVKQRTAALSDEIAERERLQDELRALSLTDELTGLHNRRGFMVMAEQICRLAKRNRQNLALLYMDFNKLKYINDTFGHAQGDQALRDVARDMEQIFRESDILARVGGDEFTALMTDCDLECARIAIDRLNEKLNLTNTTSSRFYILSLSIGLALFDPANPTSIKDLMERADADMYINKQQLKKGGS